MTNDSFLSCLSLATFDGFLSASEVSLHCAHANANATLIVVKIPQTSLFNTVDQ